MNDIIARLNYFIEYADKTRKYADAGFYEDCKAEIEQLRARLDEARNRVLEDILQQSRRVRSYTNPDKIFDAVPVRVIMPEVAEKQEKNDEI